jgi:hypothetical protein
MNGCPCEKTGRSACLWCESPLKLRLCDCRSPAPSRRHPLGARDFLQCEGCRGAVSAFRMIDENIKVRD